LKKYYAFLLLEAKRARRSRHVGENLQGRGYLAEVLNLTDPETPNQVEEGKKKDLQTSYDSGGV